MTDVQARVDSVDVLDVPNFEEVAEDVLYEAQDEPDFSEPLDLQGDRRLITQPYDYSIQQLVDEIGRGKIRLDINYQRKYVWDDGKASRLVESLLLNVPIPVCYFAEDDDFNFEVIDGLQRITSLRRFLSGEFALTGVSVLQEIAGKKFSELAPRDQRRLASRTLRCVAITSDSHPDIKFDVFERLNTNVSVLTPQEIRNCVYRGHFNDSLKEMANDATLQDLVGKSGEKRMVAEELILRFLALRDRLSDYRPPLRQFMNSYMRSRQSQPITEGEKSVFYDSLSTALDVFGPNVFRVPDRNNNVHHVVHKALFDAVMICLATTDRDALRALSADLAPLVTQLIEDEDFRASIGRATADRNRLFSRLERVGLALEKHGLKIGALTVVQADNHTS